jgi:membrane associated rhomboid family serine protease
MFPMQNAVPARYPPFVTWALIAVNCAVFFIEITLSPAELEWFLARFALIPARYFAPPPYGDPGLTLLDYVPFFSNMFLHGGWLHLMLNMWTLWLFGPTVEDRLGIPRYLLFYLACGILASVAHTLFNAGSLVPALGASGAISGVLGYFIRLFPLARLIVVVPILFLPLFFEVPAIVFAGLWLVMQVLQGTAELFIPSTGGGIVWWAHNGGFVAGVVLVPLLHRPAKRHRSYYPDEASSDSTLGDVHESRRHLYRYILALLHVFGAATCAASAHAGGHAECGRSQAWSGNGAPA